jgi:hypothetical protein
MYKICFLLLSTFLCSACNSKVVHHYPSSKEDKRFDDMESIFGKDFIFTTSKIKE